VGTVRAFFDAYSAHFPSRSCLVAVLLEHAEKWGTQRIGSLDVVRICDSALVTGLRRVGATFFNAMLDTVVTGGLGDRLGACVAAAERTLGALPADAPPDGTLPPETP
jgi:hypothetical protein